LGCDWKHWRTAGAKSKKLTGAGYIWAGGGESSLADDDVIRELRALGLNEQADALSGQTKQQAYYVWPDNWQAFELFADVSDQWLFAGMGSPVGLNGAVVLDYIRTHTDLKGGALTELYQDVRLIASGALTAWREKSDNGRK
jgi:hypothetical protein